MNNGRLGNVLVTRPAATAVPLANLLEQAGWHVQSLPMLVIKPLLATGEAPDLSPLDTSGNRTIAIFISANAVHCTAELLQAQGRQWPPSIRCVGIGEATDAAIAAQGWPMLDLPTVTGSDARDEDPRDSEALLFRLLAIDQAFDRVLLFCGRGGRRVIEQALVERGKPVVRLETYARGRPRYAAKEFSDAMLSFLEMSPARPSYMLFASAETLANFCDYAAGFAHREALFRVPVVVPGARVAGVASSLGFGSVVVAANASPQAFLRVLASL